MHTIRRTCTLWIPVEVVVALLGNWRHHTCIALPWLQSAADSQGNKIGLPPDYTVLDATYDWQRRAIGVRLTHPTFAPVADGEQDPCLYYREVVIEARPIIKDQVEDEFAPIIIEAKQG